MVRHRARIRFRKEGDLRLIGHQDLMRVWERLFRRAGLKLRMSEGFHPRPKLSLPSALALGVAGRDEVLEVEFADDDANRPTSLEELAPLLAAHAPAGLGVNAIEFVDLDAPPPEVSRVTFELPVPEQRRESLAARIAELLALSACLIDRGQDRKPLDVRPLLDEVALEDGVLRIRLRVNREGSVRPRDLLAVLGLTDVEQSGAWLARTRVELQA